jgi:hypothetical protein
VAGDVPPDSTLVNGADEAIPVAMGITPLGEPYGPAPHRSNHDAVEAGVSLAYHSGRHVGL